MTETVITGTTDTDDTYMDTANPDYNANGETVIWAGERASLAAVRRTLIKFDLSGIAEGETFDSVVLRIYANFDDSSNARTLRVYRQLRVWVEAQATWNIYSAGNNWATSGGFGAADCEQTDIGSKSLTASETLNEYKDITLVAAEVQEMHDGTIDNNGFLIKMDTENNDAYRYNASSNASGKPRLVINHSSASRRIFVIS